MGKQFLSLDAADDADAIGAAMLLRLLLPARTSPSRILAVSEARKEFGTTTVSMATVESSAGALPRRYDPLSSSAIDDGVAAAVVVVVIVNVFAVAAAAAPPPSSSSDARSPPPLLPLAFEFIHLAGMSSK